MYAETRERGDRDMPAPTSNGPVPSLRYWRLERHWTQRELAEHARVAESTVAHGEQGYALSLLTVKKLADALSVTVRQLRESEPES